MLLFMFFGLKNSVLISTAIPLSMFIGFIILSACCGITLNIVVLFSLVLVLGIVVDDAIVVIENIYRHQQEYDKSPAQAAKDAAAEVAVPVATSTFTTLAAFIPLLFWPGIVGDFMKYLPLTLIFTMGASLFVAYVISPVQGAQWINYRKEIRKARREPRAPALVQEVQPVHDHLPQGGRAVLPVAAARTTTIDTALDALHAGSRPLGGCARVHCVSRVSCSSGC